MSVMSVSFSVCYIFSHVQISWRLINCYTSPVRLRFTKMRNGDTGDDAFIECLLFVRLCPGSFDKEGFTSRKLCHAHFVDLKTKAHSSVTYPEVHK